MLSASDERLAAALVDEAVTSPERTRDGHELFAVAAFLGKPLHALRVFDYGMGLGLWANVAKALGCKVYGYDIAPTRQQLARERGIEVITPEALEGLELDFINTDQVLEHVPEPLPLLRQLRGALAPRGILKVSVPQAWGLTARVLFARWDAATSSPFSLSAVHPLEHVNAWNARALSNAAGRVGLAPTRIPLRSSFAFVTQHASVDLKSPRSMLKAMMRPVYNRHSTTNLYRWFSA